MKWNRRIAFSLLAFSCLATPGLSAAMQCESAMLLANDPQPGDGFGETCAMEGGVLVAGALGHTHPGSTGEGAAYIFEWDGSQWTEVLEVYLTEPNFVAWDFGAAVTVAGGRVFVADPYFVPVPGNAAGLIYVYERVSGIWTWTATLVGTDFQLGYGNFGWSIAAEGDRLVAGIPYRPPVTDAGAAVVLEWNGTTWSKAATLHASDAVSFATFGISVALSGDLLVVGAPGDQAHAFQAGAAYVFERQGGNWIEISKLWASQWVEDGKFGQFVEISGSTIVVSALEADDQYPPDGKVYLFERHLDGTWGPNEDAILEFDDELNTIYGRPLAVDGDRLLVGSNLDSVDGQWSGTGILYRESDMQWSTIAQMSPDDPAGSELLGTSVAISGDFLAMGAIGHDLSGSSSNEGAVVVFDSPTTVRGYCLGDSCPCANEESDYRGCTNGSGTGALLRACGTTSVMSDDLVLEAVDLRANSMALPFMASGTEFLPYGNGMRCIGGSGFGVFRFGPTQDTGPEGRITLGPGIVARSQVFSVHGHIDPGETWNFQVFHRDIPGLCGMQYNTTNALAVTFVP